MVIDTHQNCDQIKLKYNQHMQAKGAKSMHNYDTQILQINQSNFWFRHTVALSSP